MWYKHLIIKLQCICNLYMHKMIENTFIWNLDLGLCYGGDTVQKKQFRPHTLHTGTTHLSSHTSSHGVDHSVDNRYVSPESQHRCIQQRTFEEWSAPRQQLLLLHYCTKHRIWWKWDHGSAIYTWCPSRARCWRGFHTQVLSPLIYILYTSAIHAL